MVSTKKNRNNSLPNSKTFLIYLDIAHGSAFAIILLCSMIYARLRPTSGKVFTNTYILETDSMASL